MDRLLTSGPVLLEADLTPAADPALPSGTVTFLFTDVEGSTREWERDEAAMRSALARHDAIVREAIEGAEGIVFKTVGDAFCAAFRSAPAAVEAALAAQRALARDDAGSPLPRIRVAVHTGEADVRDDDYFGRAVNRVARLLSIGHGRQVLLSGSTRELVQDALPPAAALRDLGDHRLRDLERPERVFQLVHPDLPDDLPPLRSLDHHPHNLPVQLTSFVGREAALDEIRELLASHRLVTLTGAGGSGKTRLALQVAAGQVERFPDGLWFVDLSALTDPEVLPQTIASALGVRTPGGRDVNSALTEHLRARSLLVVLDNCEHLVDACAAWVEAALGAGPGVKVLATSREGLGAAGEVVWVVPPLTVPDSADLDAAELLAEIDRSEAVRLFADRAQLVQPGFEVTAEDARSIARICRRLDGIPLAIELAAARVKVLAPEQIAARLDDRFRLLAGGRRSLPRHQTLLAAIQWSHDLLSDEERILLRRCAVFTGGWSLEAAEAVCAGAAADSVLDLLTRLVEKSLVFTDRLGTVGVRYRMLESTRQYALERMIESGEAGTLRSRHAAWCLAVVDRLKERETAGEPPMYETVDPDLDNLRTALEWSLSSTDDIWTGFRIVTRLAPYFRRSGLVIEGLAWVEKALEATAGTDAPERARGFAAAATLTYFLGDLERSTAAGRRALEAAEGADEETRMAVLAAASRSELHSGDPGREAHGLAMTEEALEIAHRLGNRHIEAVLHIHLGEGLREAGDLEGARRRYLTCLELAPGLAAPLFNLGQVAIEAARPDEAEEWYRKDHQVVGRSGDRMGWAYQVLGMGQVAAARGDHARAARLLGAAEAAFEEFGERLNRVDQRVLDPIIAACRQMLGVAAYEAERERGRRMEIEAALEEALASPA